MKQLLLVYTAILVILLSCQNQKAGVDDDRLSFSKAIAVDPSPASCASFTRDTKGDIILSFAKVLSDSQSVVCYAVSTDKGKTFGKPVAIAASSNVHPHAENMPKLQCKVSGEMIAAWGAMNPSPENPYSGLVYYAQSFDKGKTWSAAKRLVSDPAGIDQRYFDMALLPNGEAAIVWLDNRKKPGKTGSAVYFATTNKGNGFDNEKLIAESSCECCRTDLYIDRKSNIHVTFRGILSDSIRDVVHTVSTDGGRSFSRPERLSNDNWVIKGCPHTGPSMVETPTGLHFAWYTLGSGSGLYFCSALGKGKGFSPRDSIRNYASARHPQMAALPGGELLIAWDETEQQGQALRTDIVVQKRSSNGKPLFTRHLSSDTHKSTYPVLHPVDDHTLLIAYGKSRNDKSYVVYQMLSFK